MALVNVLEDWLRHIDAYLAKKDKDYEPFRESLEGKDFEGNPREYDDSGNPIHAPNEGHNRQLMSKEQQKEQKSKTAKSKES